MLKQRVLTALVLAPLALWGIVALPETAFDLIWGAIVALAAWEWGRLGGLSGRVAVLYALGIAALIAGLFVAPAASRWQAAVLLLAGLWWLGLLFRLGGFRHRPVPHGVHPFSALASGIPVLLGVYFAIVLLRHSPGLGYPYIILLMLLVWGADTAAYFAGRAFGRHKLLPSVSPGKTWEGVIGALFASLVIAAVGALWFDLPPERWPVFLAVSLVTVIFSVVGDLNESYFKRRAGMKDSSHLLPGHGGILDRLDSLTAAAPIFLMGLNLLVRTP